MRSFLLSILSGVLLALSLPPYDLSWLAWFALVPLLLASKSEDRVLEVAGRGLLVGVVAGAIHARFSGGLFLVFAYLPFLWFGVLCAIFAVASHKLRERKPLIRVAMLACVGVLAEWLTTLTPLPINFSVTQHRVLDVIQIADITGIWGVSFLLWFANAALASAIVERRNAWKTQFVPSMIGAAMILFSFGYSRFRLAQPQTPPILRVAAVQAFEPNGAHGFADAVESDAKLRETLTRKAVRDGARLVVCSEEILGDDFQPAKASDATRELARVSQTHLVAGYIDNATSQSFNSAALLSPTGKVLGVHQKIHLYAGERSTTAVGTTPTVVNSSLGKIGIAICFDTCWTNVVRDETNRGAQIIAMPNFDPPVPRGVVHYLHGAMLPFRAIENRVPIVRADPNGQSGIIDAKGRVLESLTMQSAGVSVQNVNLGNGQGTPFSRWGEWFVWLCALGLTISLLESRRAMRLTKNKA